MSFENIYHGEGGGSNGFHANVTAKIIHSEATGREYDLRAT